MCTAVSEVVVEKTAFSSELIDALLAREVLAARFEAFCTPQLSAHLLGGISGVEGEGYADEPTFKKVIGGAVYDAAQDARLLSYYLDSAPEWADECRRAFFPFVNPADRLRYELGSVWPGGCRLERFFGRAGFAGLVRAFGADAEARPHQDMTHWDIPHVPEIRSMIGQLSCVIYFGCSEKGGELELWNWGYSDPDEYEHAKVPGDYGIDRARIGPSSAILSPKVGELIVFNPRNLHAVRKTGTGGKRCTQSLFVSYRGKQSGLGVYS